MQEQSAFRFLNDEEFARLAMREKAFYLARAQQELVSRQEKLREQVKVVILEQGKPTP